MKIVRLSLLIVLLFGTIGSSYAQKQNGSGSSKQLDIESTTPFVLPKPTFDSLIVKTYKKRSSINFQLNEYVDRDSKTVKDWLKENEIADVEFVIPKFPGDKSTVPAEIPLSYKNFKLTKGLAYTNCNIYLYGDDFSKSRFLLITNTNRTSIISFFDFENYTAPPKVANGDEDFVYEQLQWAMMDDKNILYVTNAHSTYASSSFGQNGYVTAIDLKSKKVLWRSRPLVSNSNFTIVGDYIVTGYGFTKEDDYLYYLDRYSGKVKGTIPLL